jgi:cytochrome c-type biogenesis protein CcmF
MIAEIGHFALIIALVTSILQASVPLIATYHAGLNDYMRLAVPLQLLSAAGIIISFACLLVTFITSDFSVALVAQHSHSLKPMLYKISGSWGNHEGSLLLWCVILALYGTVFACSSRALSRITHSRILAIHAMVSIAFLSFSLFTSNPFERLSPAPIDGQGLNPVLQDVGLALHPPTLYLGYVGLSLAFAFAVAGLLDGCIDKIWAQALKPYITAAWCALTAGIALGSWWAYYELGWGGWWFWDPVENASLMPWLAATALLHSTNVVAAKEGFRSWTVLLAILGFSLSLIGTFIVRSGLLTSVHSFASDPARGVFILGILMLAIGLPLCLYVWRGPQLAAKNTTSFMVSRETGLLINNALLLVSTAIILLGTFYPLGLEVMTGARITVGPPYFAATFSPVMGIAVFFMGIGPVLAWHRGRLSHASLLFIICGLSVGVAAIICFSLGIKPAALAGISLAIWLLASIVSDIILRLKPWRIAGLGARTLSLPAPQWGMWCAHFGMVIFLAGALGEGLYQREAIQRVQPGSVISLGPYSITFKQILSLKGANYQTQTAELALFDDEGNFLSMMMPEKRFYPAEKQVTTEAAIRSSLLGDVYAVLGDGDDDKGYTIRLYHKPLVSWIWGGAAIMVLGGAIAAFGRRRKTPLPYHEDTV